MELSANEILKLLPHRYPFLLVDKITEVIAGERAVGVKNVTVNEPFFPGHFPDRPIMPGVLMVEMIAQVGAIALLANEGNVGKMAFIAGIEKCRFRKPVVPGDQMVADVIILWIRGPVGRFKGVVKVGDKVVCEAEVSFALMLKGDSISQGATKTMPRHEERKVE